MDNKELEKIREEIRSTDELVKYNMKTHFLPLTSRGMLSLIERVRILRKQLADAEADMMKNLYHQIQSN